MSLHQLQRKFLIVYTCMVFAYWLMKNYTYALFNLYEYTKQEIILLFIIGFASSAVIGPYVGMLADKYGSKKMIKWCAFIYTLSCFTKHFNDFNILAFGQFLDGIATSILMTVFDTWLIRLDLGEKLLEETFEMQVVVNSIVAVLSSTVTSIFILEGDNLDLFYYGDYTVPFDMAIIVLTFGIYLLNRYWTTDKKRKYNNDFIITKENVILAWIQSLFEASMFLFFFALRDENIIVFSLMMMSMAAGSKIKMKLIEVLSLGSVSFLLGPLFKIYGWYSVRLIYLFSFMLINMSLGAYFPVMSLIKSKVVPEEHRATFYNIMRIPMNIIVALVMTQTSRIDDILVLSSQMLFVAIILNKLI